MFEVSAPELAETSGNDPLGYGLKSNAEPLQRWWLIEQGNPYFDADVRRVRVSLEIPGLGFSDAASYVDCVSRKAIRHGHDLPIYLRIGGQVLDNPESLTRFHYRDLTWPLPDKELPSRCCPTDPLFEEAKLLARRYGINLASFEPGFPDATGTVVGYLLGKRWPHPRSSRGIKWTEITDIIVPYTGDRMLGRISNKDLGLKSKGGEGRQLPQWYSWWKLDRDGKSIREIAEISDEEQSIPRNYDERTIRHGIKTVERLMAPLEIPR